MSGNTLVSYLGNNHTIDVFYFTDTRPLFDLGGFIYSKEIVYGMVSKEGLTTKPDTN